MRALSLFAAGLAFVVVTLGAYVRLSDAGLGCPDWPGCYGHPTPALANLEISAAQAADPVGPVSPAKAWKEMIHRYLAGTLGLTLFVLAASAWRTQRGGRRTLPTALAALVVFQALLGMWTVTRQLWPAVVTAHLIGGMTTLALLVWLASERKETSGRTYRGLRLPAALLLVLVALQIALGGWTSSNYAALACGGLPGCQGQVWPAMDWRDAFDLGHPPGGLPSAALVAIQLAHRLGALAVLAGALWLVRRLLNEPGWTSTGWLLLMAVACQWLLGIGNVLLSLPLPVAVAHNAGAASLLAVVVWINVRLRRCPP